MVIGSLNPNMVIPLVKLCITNLDKNEKIYVLYNPESYVQGREVKYSEANSLQIEAPSLQFVHGTSETIQMELFFDTFSSGAEVGGKFSDKAMLALNSALPSAAKTDVRKYTSQIYSLTKINTSTHAPPLLKLEWSSLQFKGYLINCNQKFTKFNELGNPVRATLTCTFKQYVKIGEQAKLSPKESPDTTKYRTIENGSSLWSLSASEYGMCEMWREIADANGIDNPRLLNTGDVIKLPAIK